MQFLIASIIQSNKWTNLTIYKITDSDLKYNWNPDWIWTQDSVCLSDVLPLSNWDSCGKLGLQCVCAICDRWTVYATVT